MKLYGYNSVRLGRKPERHKPVGWHLHEQNLFSTFLDHIDKRTAKFLQISKH